MEALTVRDVLGDVSMISIDTETTGLDFNNDEIIEFAAVVPLKDDVRVVDFYLRTERPITDAAQAKNGLTWTALARKSLGCSRKEILGKILDFLYAFRNDTLFVAMNMPFDLTMIVNNLYATFKDSETRERIDELKNLHCLDVYVVDQVLRPYTGGGGRRLATLAEVYGTVTKPSHNAVDDAKCVMEIAIAQLQSLAESDAVDVNDLDSISAFMEERAIAQQESLSRYFEGVGKDPLEHIGFPCYDMK